MGQENGIVSYEEKTGYMKIRGWLLIYYCYNCWVMLGDVAYLVTY